MAGIVVQDQDIDKITERKIDQLTRMLHVLHTAGDFESAAQVRASIERLRS